MGEPAVSQEFDQDEALASETVFAEARFETNAPPKKPKHDKIDPIQAVCFDPVGNARMYFGVALIEAENGGKGSRKDRANQCREAHRHFDFAQSEMARSSRCCPKREKLGNKALLDLARDAFAMRAKAEAMLQRNCPRSI